MDILHHSLIGAIGYGFCASQDQELAGLAFVAGSVFPDLDALLVVFGRKTYLKYHQGPTHSLLLAPIFALVPPLLCIPLVGFDILIWLAGWMGLLIHNLLDWLNTFRIALFWPISKQRYSQDAVFFIDTFSWCLTGMGFLCVIYNAAPIAYFFYGTVFMAYLFFRVVLQRMVKSRLNVAFVIPSSLNPFLFYILEQVQGGVKTYAYHAISKKNSNVRFFEEPPVAIRDLTQKSSVFIEIEKVVRFLFVTSFESKEGRTQIVARDLAIRNFGGKFGETRLLFNEKEELIDEKANI